MHGICDSVLIKDKRNLSIDMLTGALTETPSLQNCVIHEIEQLISAKSSILEAQPNEIRSYTYKI